MTHSLAISDIPSGRYVAAVSGGIDSMVLLDALYGTAGLKLVVAHFDHGIRPDSALDRQLVQYAAQCYGLPFEYAEVKLPQGVGEAAARQARYDFLRQVRQRHRARAIITAHHQDDALETAAINLIRGTGPRGLAALRSGDDLVRPLLGASKQDIIQYARSHGIVWREDSTNADESYLRNKLRRRFLPQLTAVRRQELLDIIQRQARLNDQLDRELAEWIVHHVAWDNNSARLARYQMVMLPQTVALAIIQCVCKNLSGNTVQTHQARHALHFAKSALAGKTTLLNARLRMRIQKGGTVHIYAAS